jgi:predicted transcriptional regulator
MLLEIDTSLLKKIDTLSLNQLVFLSLVLDNNQKSIKDVAAVVSQVSDNEIQDLIDKDLIIRDEKNKKVTYKETSKLVEIITGGKDKFEEFKAIYPTVVTRPDGTKGFLQGNSKKCRDYYNKLVKNDMRMHEHIIKCLNYEIQNKTMTGKLGYMKTMWKWLTNHEWEIFEEQVQDEPITEQLYGTELL